MRQPLAFSQCALVVPKVHGWTLGTRKRAQHAKARAAGGSPAVRLALSCTCLTHCGRNTSIPQKYVNYKCDAPSFRATPRSTTDVCLPHHAAHDQWRTDAPAFPLRALRLKGALKRAKAGGAPRAHQSCAKSTKGLCAHTGEACPPTRRATSLVSTPASQPPVGG